MWTDFFSSPWTTQLLGATVVLVLVLVAHWLLIRRSREMGAGKRFPRQMLMLTLTGVAIVFLIIVVTEGESEDELRRQVFAILGVLISLVLGLSSTTFVSNAMAGLLVRQMRNFRNGDFIRVGGQFGRVTEKGLFHTEIQTEDRDLVTLPNLYVVTNPIRVVRSSGTFVSVSLSLGYDVPRSQVEDLLKQGAEDAGLDDAFVHVEELGDFSVGYRVSGLLREVRQLRTARSNLRKATLDRLHRAGVEIASPTIMSQRPVDPEQKFLPALAPHSARPKLEDESEADAIIFDKADEAEAREQLHREHDENLGRLDELKNSLDDAEDEHEAAQIRAQIVEAESRNVEISEELESVEAEDE